MRRDLHTPIASKKVQQMHSHEREMEKGRILRIDEASGSSEAEKMNLLGELPIDDPDTPKKTSAPTMSLLSTLDTLPRIWKFCLLVVGLFFFFGVHNLLQEQIMHFPGFTFGWSLGFLEVLGVTVFSYWERRWYKEAGVRRGSWRSYVGTTLCLMGSSSLANKALDYINYPTKVVFRSCKLIPTMVISSVMNQKPFKGVEYAAAVAVCVGLILFAFADVRVAPSFSPWGITLVSLSVVCDAVLPNLQERLFAEGSSRLEVTFYSNILTLGLMSVSTLLSGDLLGALAYAQADHKAAVLLLVYTLLAYVAISLHMALVKSFGSVAAVLVGNSRKTMTICLSFLLFPKPFSNLYVVGGMLVLAGLTVSVYVKNMDKKKGADDAVLNCKGEVVGPTAVGNGGLIQQ
ncbi:udp-galactose transporter [Nannochloropsis gaditana]|uniref:Udp-galactose transporter n=1 Tax=Nannochloropsis gaditana TaxID=72520 RepID=W7U2S7_9STRA|nr:udp-galactose transporter [Nannochloropsis gaditana]